MIESARPSPIERLKRLRYDGVDQYISLNLAEHPSIKRFIDDPWDDGVESPIRLQKGSHFQVVIMGAGYGGLLFAARLLDSDSGIKPEDILVIDSAAGFGGMWYWNRYPGLMCDIESYIYMPLLEETGYVPKHKYAHGEELRKHANRIAKHWNIDSWAMFRTIVHQCAWEEDTSEWVLELTQRSSPTSEDLASSNTERIRADFVIMVPGLLNRPKLPLVPGLDTFKVTGGSPCDQVLSNLRDKKVGIIGTGATAIQIVPVLAKWSKRLFMSQRTPAAVDIRGQQATGPDEWAKEISTGSGWQMARTRNFLSFTDNSQPSPPVDMVSDGWTRFPSYSVLTGSPKVTDVTIDNAGEYVTEMQQLDLVRSEKVRNRVDQVVQNRQVAEKLKAWYPGWCKRPTFHDEYLQAFNLPKVVLTHNLDVLIFSTGFEFGTFGSPASRCGAKVVGRNGRTMDEKWAQPLSEGQLALSLHGLCSRDFPNMIFTSSNQAGIASAFTPTLDTFAQHAAFIMSNGFKN
ncbi:hypothetical protein BDV97DRAFT_374626 [Delphinella strobiligena]|nr:hypothetical protein BDV97DRAFT_374626 [Delphinella strobiligena]